MSVSFILSSFMLNLLFDFWHFENSKMIYSSSFTKIFKKDTKKKDFID